MNPVQVKMVESLSEDLHFVHESSPVQLGPMEESEERVKDPNMVTLQENWNRASEHPGLTVHISSHLLTAPTFLPMEKT